MAFNIKLIDPHIKGYVSVHPSSIHTFIYVPGNVLMCGKARKETKSLLSVNLQN